MYLVCRGEHLVSFLCVRIVQLQAKGTLELFPALGLLS